MDLKNKINTENWLIINQSGSKTLKDADISIICKALRLYIDHSAAVVDKLEYQGSNKTINKINKESTRAETIYNKLRK